MEAKITTKNLEKRRFIISKKEKKLFLLLFLVTIFWLFNKFVFTVQGIKIAELKQEKDNYKKELSNIDTMLSKDSAIVDKWTRLNGGIDNIIEKYFSATEQPEIMHVLSEIIDNSSLKVPGIYFAEPDYSILDDIKIKYIGVSIPFEGSYDDLGTFFAHLSLSSKRFVVTQFNISKNDIDTLSGQISLKAYSFDEVIEYSTSPINKMVVKSVMKENPFIPFEGYIEESDYDAYYGYNDNLTDKDIEKRTILEEFEGEDIYFMASSNNVTGKVTKFNSPKNGKHSLRAEYFISADYEEERAYVVLDDKEIYLKYPPSSIGVWVYSYGYSPILLGFRFQDQEGNKIDSELARGVSWIGWEFIEAMPPQDIKMYPLKLDRIYLQLGANRHDYGVILFDDLEASYPNVISEENQDNGYSFYVVQHGDTLMSISEKTYGTSLKYELIMNQNGLNSNSELEVGQILVIPN